MLRSRSVCPEMKPPDNIDLSGERSGVFRANRELEEPDLPPHMILTSMTKMIRIKTSRWLVFGSIGNLEGKRRSCQK